MATARHILVPTQELCDQIKQEIKTNELNKKFTQMGYLEKKSKDYHLTKNGKSAGGETKSNRKRAYILRNESVEKDIKEHNEKVFDPSLPSKPFSNPTPPQKIS